jgi:hypothetical protein
MTSPTDLELYSQVNLIEGDVPVLDFFSRALPPLEHSYILLPLGNIPMTW